MSIRGGRGPRDDGRTHALPARKGLRLAGRPRAGLARIKDYVGQGRSYPTWVHAARGVEATHGAAHPGQCIVQIPNGVPARTAATPS